MIDRGDAVFDALASLTTRFGVGNHAGTISSRLPAVRDRPIRKRVVQSLLASGWHPEGVDERLEVAIALEDWNAAADCGEAGMIRLTHDYPGSRPDELFVVL